MTKEIETQYTWKDGQIGENLYKTFHDYTNGFTIFTGKIVKETYDGYLVIEGDSFCIIPQNGNKEERIFVNPCNGECDRTVYIQ